MKCDKQYRLSFTEQAMSIVKGLSLEEKVSLMGGNMSFEDMMPESVKNDKEIHYNVIPYCAGGIKASGIPPMLFVDGQHGVVCGSGQISL